MIRAIKESSKSLKEIATHLGLEAQVDLTIRGICSSSKNVEPGDLFVALAGAKSHGADFISEAISKGASAVLTDATGAELVANKLPTLVITNPRKQMGSLSDWFYGSPSSKFNLYGITGTNGKTTTSYLLNQIWKSAGKSTALVGTLGIEICGENKSSGFTTPEADALQNVFAAALERNVANAVMEVSSIAIEMDRIKGARFKCVSFSNLTQDHLDFHGSMESYAAAKKKLFTLEYADSALINIDDEFGVKLFTDCQIPAASVSRENPKATWHFSSITKSGAKTSVSIRGEGGILIEGEISLIGGYNLDNLLMAVAMASHSGVDPLVIAATLPNLKGAPGRMELIEVGQKFIALVDYAHTPDAVVRALEAVKPLSNKVIAVLGCGGDRDSGKREIMGAALSKGSDISIFTSDNPRSEDPDAILKMMMKSVKEDESNIKVLDRREAISLAVASAEPGDCVIILGKGHESGQEIAGKVMPFDDRTELTKAIEGLA